MEYTSCEGSSSLNHEQLRLDYVPIIDRLFPLPSARELLRPPQRIRTILDELEQIDRSGPPRRISTILDWMDRPWFRLRDRLFRMLLNGWGVRIVRQEARKR